MIRNTFRAGLCALTLSLTASMAYGQAVSETKEATAVDKSSWGIFKDSSVFLQSRVTLNDTSRDNKASYKITPIFSTPMFNNSFKMDFYVDITAKDSTGINQTDTDGGNIELTKTLVSNDMVLLEPYLMLDNIFSSTRSIRPSVRTIVNFPIDLGEDGKITPFIYNETNAAFHTDEALVNEEKAGDRNALGAKVIEDLKIESVKNVDRAKVNTWTRFAVALEPNAIEGLKLTAGAEVDYTFNQPKTVISAKDLTVVDYEDALSTAPIFRIDYQVNDRLAIRNHSSVSMDNFFERPSKNQSENIGFTNYTRVTYTLL